MSAPTTAPAPPRTGVAVPVAVGVVVASVVAVFAIVGLVVSLSSDRLPSGPALAPPAPAEPEVSYDALQRRADFANITVEMPSSPYECPSSPGPIPPVLTSGVLCDATVHENYRGSADWAASAGFGTVPDELTGGTATETAQAVFGRLQTAAFPNVTTTVTARKTDQAELNNERIPVVSGNVNYEVPGVPSRFDRLLVIVLPARGGGYVAYFSSRPDDTPASTLAVLNASINSLRVK